MTDLLIPIKDERPEMIMWSAATPVAAVICRSASCGWRKVERELALAHSTREVQQ